MGWRTWLLVLAVLVPAVAQAPEPVAIISAGPEIRVLLAVSKGPVEVSSEGDVLAVTPESQLWSSRFRLEPGSARAEDGRLLQAGEVEFFAAGAPLVVAGRAYRGTLLALERGSELWLVNRLSVEDYLKGVVPRELLCGEPEAMKAQAVLARTYALARRRADHPYDLGSGTGHQVYGGLGVEHPAATLAVAQTRGQVLGYRGAMVKDPLYHSTCGGRTEDNDRVFRGGPVPYLRSSECGYCTASHRYRWQARLGWKELASALGKAGAPLGSLTVVSAGASGHVTLLGVEGPGLSLEVRGDQLRSLLKVHLEDGGPVPLPSTRFEVEQSEEPGFFTLVGRGWGHGVGMCQWGAIGMARAGFGYQEILARYFQGAQVLEPDS